MKPNFFSALVALLFLGCATVTQQSSEPCFKNPACVESGSKELQALVKADQEVRFALIKKGWDKFTENDLKEFSYQDTVRRKRVAEIFAEGCFSKAQDYAAAALVFQHGVTPDHFFQTFVWSKRAIELGDPSQTQLMAMSIDRYLVNTKRKQLFGSQAMKPTGGNCWCLYPVEQSFSDSSRKQYLNKTQSQQIEWLHSLNKDQQCKEVECKMVLVSPKPGDAPGIW